MERFNALSIRLIVDYIMALDAQIFSFVLKYSANLSLVTLQHFNSEHATQVGTRYALNTWYTTSPFGYLYILLTLCPVPMHEVSLKLEDA